MTAWYRAILDDPAARPDPLDPDARRRVALALAEAEAHLERVCRAELAEIAAEPEEMESPVPVELEHLTREGWWEVMQDLLEQAPCQKLMARYRAEAEARRTKALRRWIEALGDRAAPAAPNPETKPVLT